MSTAGLDDFDKLWDYDQPAESERRFRELLPVAEAAPNREFHVELLTQIARSQGLQRTFDEAHRTLDAAEAMLDEEMRRAPIRLMLERGRAFRSSGDPTRARPFFLDAWELGRDFSEDALALDAAHMVALVGTPDERVEWALRSIEVANAATDPAARKWLGPLYNNLGWTYHDSGRLEDALEMFKRGLAFRESQGDPKAIRIARWAIARTLRSLGRLDDALAMQRDLAVEHAAAGTSDGFVQEELGECLLALNRTDEARPHFARAHEILSQDIWLAANEKPRLERLAHLAM